MPTEMLTKTCHRQRLDWAILRRGAAFGWSKARTEMKMKPQGFPQNACGGMRGRLSEEEKNDEFKTSISAMTFRASPGQVSVFPRNSFPASPTSSALNRTGPAF